MASRSPSTRRNLGGVRDLGGVWRHIVWAIAAMLACSCGTATLTLRDGSEIEASIMSESRNDLEYLHLADGTTVRRSEVVDIDHPGAMGASIAAAVTLGPALLGLLYDGLIAPPPPGWGIGPGGGVAVLGTIAGVIATPIAGVGTYWASYQAARAPSPEAVSIAQGATPDLMVVVVPYHQRPYVGAAVGWRW